MSACGASTAAPTETITITPSLETITITPPPETVTITPPPVTITITPPLQESPPQIIESLSPEEAFALIQDNQNNPDFVIIDVRTLGAFATEHIENAILIDYYSLTFRDELDNLDKDKVYLIYC